MTKDPEKGTFLIQIMGWDEKGEYMKDLLFNGETGEFKENLKGDNTKRGYSNMISEFHYKKL